MIARSALTTALAERGWRRGSARQLDDAIRTAATRADSTLEITLASHGSTPRIYSLSSIDGRVTARRLTLPSALFYDMADVHALSTAVPAVDDATVRVRLAAISTILELPEVLPEGLGTVRTPHLTNTRRNRVSAVMRQSSGSKPVVWDAGRFDKSWPWIRLRAIELILEKELPWAERPDAWRYGRSLCRDPTFVASVRDYLDAPESKAEARLAISPIVLTVLLFGDPSTAAAIRRPETAEPGNRGRVADDVSWVFSELAEDDTLWKTVAPERGKGAPLRELALHLRRHWTHLRRNRSEYIDALSVHFRAWSRGETRDANVMNSLIAVDREAARRVAIDALRQADTLPGYFILRHVLRSDLNDAESQALRTLLGDDEWGNDALPGDDSLRDVLQEKLDETNRSPR